MKHDQVEEHDWPLIPALPHGSGEGFHGWWAIADRLTRSGARGTRINVWLAEQLGGQDRVDTVFDLESSVVKARPAIPVRDPKAERRYTGLDWQNRDYRLAKLYYIGSHSLVPIRQLIPAYRPIKIGSEFKYVFIATGGRQVSLRDLFAKNPAEDGNLGGALRETRTVLGNLRNAIDRDENDSSSPDYLEPLVEKFGDSALDALDQILSDGEIDPAFAAEVLRGVGAIGHSQSAERRFALLSRTLDSQLPQVRYGSLFGLLRLGDQRAADRIRNAFQRESIGGLRRDMEKVLARLEGRIGDVRANG